MDRMRREFEEKDVAWNVRPLFHDVGVGQRQNLVM